MNNFHNDVNQVSVTPVNRLEYIRWRLLIMALLPSFEELVNLKVHLYLESGFNEVLCKRLGISRKKICNYIKIAKAFLKVREGVDCDFFQTLVFEYSEEYSINFKILPENEALLEILLNEFAG